MNIQSLRLPQAPVIRLLRAAVSPSGIPAQRFHSSPTRTQLMPAPQYSETPKNHNEQKIHVPFIHRQHSSVTSTPSHGRLSLFPLSSVLVSSPWEPLQTQKPLHSTLYSPLQEITIPLGSPVDLQPDTSVAKDTSLECMRRNKGRLTKTNHGAKPCNSRGRKKRRARRTRVYG